MSAAPSAGVALVPVLEAEHVMVWAYGTLGPRLSGDDRDEARTLLIAHERTRDELHAAIRAAGGTPPAARPAYELPFPLTDADSARKLAADIETRLAAVYADLVAAFDAPDTRTRGVTGLVTAVTRARSWGALDVPFPGLPERAPR